MNERIRQLRKSLGLSQKEFANRIGLNQNTISYMEKIGNKVTEQNIKVICSQFDVNENWLRTGSGKPLLRNSKKQKEFFDIFDDLCPELQDHIIEIAKTLRDAQSKTQSCDD